MKQATRLAHAGRTPSDHYGVVNTPVYHASTILFDTLEDFDRSDRNPFAGVHYGRLGTPTHFGFEQAMDELLGAFGTVSTCSGQAAIAISILSVAEAGAHLLVADNVYGPTRRLCDGLMARLGITTEYFDPLISADELAAKFTPQTRAVFLEAPGSLTFEISDVPALSQVAHDQGACVIADMTWATPLYFDAFAHGVDLSVHAATKYIVGHSDAMLGTVSAIDERRYRAIRETAVSLGYCAGPDDVYLGARGLRTMGQRLPVHEANGLALANWLAERAGVMRVLHPARADHPQHDIWRRDFSGACGLFAFELAAIERDRLARLVEGLSYFGLGVSWGGYESLVLPVDPSAIRSAVAWQTAGPWIRVHAGLEDIDDLIEDFDAGMRRAGW